MTGTEKMPGESSKRSGRSVSAEGNFTPRESGNLVRVCGYMWASHR
jgi:hypothetical protein